MKHIQVLVWLCTLPKSFGRQVVNLAEFHEAKQPKACTRFHGYHRCILNIEINDKKKTEISLRMSNGV